MGKLARVKAKIHVKGGTEIGEAYELESRKERVTINRAFQVGIAVYRLAKLRMLKFYYVFLERFIDRRDFELIKMDTETNYLAISGESPPPPPPQQPSVGGFSL